MRKAVRGVLAVVQYGQDPPIEFGALPAETTSLIAGSEKPETFNFLGFTFISVKRNSRGSSLSKDNHGVDRMDGRKTLRKDQGELRRRICISRSLSKWAPLASMQVGQRIIGPITQWPTRSCAEAFSLITWSAIPGCERLRPERGQEGRFSFGSGGTA